MIVGVTGTQYDRIRGYPILGGCRSGGGGGIRLITVRSRRGGGGGRRILHGGDFPFVKVLFYISLVNGVVGAAAVQSGVSRL